MASNSTRLSLVRRRTSTLRCRPSDDLADRLVVPPGYVPYAITRCVCGRCSDIHVDRHSSSSSKLRRPFFSFLAFFLGSAVPLAAADASPPTATALRLAVFVPVAPVVVEVVDAAGGLEAGFDDEPVDVVAAAVDGAGSSGKGGRPLAVDGREERKKN